MPPVSRNSVEITACARVHRTSALACTMAFSALLATAQAKTLVYCSEGSPENFNPMLNTTGTTFDANEPIYNRLVRVPDRAPPRSRRRSPNAGTIAEDGKSFTFHLRHGVKWQSQQDLQADPRLQRRRRDVLVRAAVEGRQPVPQGVRRRLRLLQRHELQQAAGVDRRARRRHGALHADRSRRRRSWPTWRWTSPRSSRRNTPMRC